MEESNLELVAVGAGGSGDREGLALSQGEKETTLTNSSAQPKEFFPSTSIEAIVHYIVVEKLECGDVPCDEWTKKLTDNLITNLGLLCRLSPKRLEKLELPLLLEEELIQIITSVQEKSSIKPLAVMKVDHSRNSKGPPTEQRSAFLGLTDIERETILQSWKTVVEIQGKDMTSLFEKFYQIFFQLDKTARRLFMGRSLEKQSVALTKVIGMIMSTLTDPTTMLPYVQRLGARHLIYGVNQKDFQSFAIAFTQTLSEYVPNIMTPSLKEAYFVLILKLGQTMTENYDELMRGLKCTLGKSNDKDKKRLFCLLTHQSLAIYKDEEMTKETTTIWLKWISDIDLVNDEKHLKYYPHCFSITIGDIKFYYGVETKDDLSWWITELGERVAAHHHIAADEDEMSDSASATDTATGISKKEMKKLKKLKKKLVGSKLSQSSTTSLSLKDDNKL